MTDYSHLEAETQAHLSLSDDARMELMIEDIFIPHDRLTAILDHVEFLRYQAPKSRATGLALVGPPGSGKTLLAQAIQRRFGAEPASETRAASQPIVLLNMTGAREAKTLYNRLLDALGCPDASSYRGSDRERMAMKLCRAANVRMLIVDELQDILQVTDRQRTIALDTIKTLMNDLCIPVLALGVQDVRKALECNPHLNARFVYRELPVWAADTYLANFLHSLEGALPLRKASHLSSLSMMRCLVKASRGSLDAIVKYVCWAAVYAVEDGSEQVTPCLIAKAVAQPPKAAVKLQQERERNGKSPHAAAMAA